MCCWKLVLDGICSLLCAGLAGRQQGELKARHKDCFHPLERSRQRGGWVRKGREVGGGGEIPACNIYSSAGGGLLPPCQDQKDPFARCSPGTTKPSLKSPEEGKPSLQEQPLLFQEQKKRERCRQQPTPRSRLEKKERLSHPDCLITFCLLLAHKLMWLRAGHL